jgi:sugar lactone lactonase YvrE
MHCRTSGTPDRAPGRTGPHQPFRSPAVFSRILATAGLLLCGMALARADEVYIAYDGANNTIQQYASGQISGDSYNGTTFTQTSLAADSGLAFDSSGDLFVANSGNNNITEYNPAGQLIRTISTSAINNPAALAFDQFGDLYVANSGNGNILKFTPSGISTSTSTVFSSGVGSPNGLAFDSQGNLYVSNIGGSIIYKIAPTGGTPSTFISPGDFSTINHPRGIAFNSQGDLFVANADSSLNDIEEFSPSGVAMGVFASSSAGLDTPDGIAFDSSGDLYVVNFSHTGPENETSPGSSAAFEFSPTGVLLQAFNDNTSSDLEDGGYIAIETNSGSPVLGGSVPEPSVAGLFVLGTASFCGFSWMRRRRRV